MNKHRNHDDAPSSAPMRPRHGRRFRSGLREGTQSAHMMKYSRTDSEYLFDAVASLPALRAGVR